MNIINNRLSQLRELMAQRGIDFYIVPTGDPHGSEYIDAHYKEREYMTGFTGSAGTLLVSKEDAILFVDGRYHIQAEEECTGAQITIYKLGLPDVPNCPEYLCKHICAGQIIGFDGSTMSQQSFENIKKKVGDVSVSYYVEEDLVDIIWNKDRPECTQNAVVPLENFLMACAAKDELKAGGYANGIMLTDQEDLRNNGIMSTNREGLQDSKIMLTPATDKLTNLRNRMAEENLDGILVSELSDICWLLNVRGSDIEYNPVMMAYLLVMKDSCTLFIRNAEYYNECCDVENDDAVQAETESGLHKIAPSSLPEYMKSIECNIAEYDDITLELAKLKNKKIGVDITSTNCLNYKILDCGNYITEIKNYEYIPKHIKDGFEIELARKYHELDAVAMIRFIMWVKEQAGSSRNIDDENECRDYVNQNNRNERQIYVNQHDETNSILTEIDAARYLDNLRSKNEGFVSLSFETISAYGSNGAIVHYSPNEKTCATLEPKGLLLVDSGAQYAGATTDITRTISLGELTQEEKTNYTLVLKGNLRLMNATFLEGCRGENLDILAREPLWEAGLDYLHGTGHGIGAFLNVHEGPCSIRFRINNDASQPALKAGMILSDEPGVYIEGKHGVRHETQLLIVEKNKTNYGTFLGFEPLSLVPFERESIVKELMTSEEIDILNNYHKLCYERVEKYLTEEEREWLKGATKEV